MSNFEKITINDGDKDISMTLIATFSMDDQDYAVLDGDDDERFVLRMKETDDEIIFETIDDEEEFNDAVQVFEELIEEQQ